MVKDKSKESPSSSSSPLSGALSQLRVAVKGGGSLVTHPPVISPDSKTIYTIQNNTLLLHDTGSGRCVGKFTTPSASPIANIGVSSEDMDRILVLTSSGQLLEVEVSTLGVVSRRELVWRNRQWPGVTSFSNFVWPSTLSIESPPTGGGSYFFVVGYTAESPDPNLYSVQYSRSLSSSSSVGDNNNDNYPGGQGQGQLPYRHEYKGILPSMHSVACGQHGQFVVAIQSEDLFVKDMSNQFCKWHKSGTRKFTCVAVHPMEWGVCATGDDSGRILVWSNVLDNHAPVVKSIYHWHTLPVADLCFSASGSQIYSGGGECALVKWDINGSGNKRVLPRLGLPIRHVRGSLTDEVIAVAQADNGIKLINAYNEVSNHIQNLTQCYIPEGVNDVNASETSLGGSKVFQAGLHLDPNNHSLVTNGKPGHLQCYSFREDRHLYNLDITQQNFITAERNNPIPNSDVTHASYSKNGTWLATAESRNDGTQCTELRLKFWKFESARQIFVLNTSVDWPHEEGIQELRIQPISDSDPQLVAVTSGLDKKFKTWGIIHDKSIHGKNEWWNCEFVGTYRGLSCGPLSFSEDGSLLAVSFEQILTIWGTDSNELKLTLCHTRLPDPTRLVEFGSHQSAHLIIAAYPEKLAVWDVITSSLLWVAPFDAESITVDPYSNLAAAFSTKHHLIFFSPDNSKPIASHKNVSSSTIVSALFVPHGKSFESMKLKSTLFFINTSQELCALLPPVEEVEETIRITKEAGKSLLTPFAQLIAEKTVYERQGKEGGSSGSQKVNLEGYKILREIMDQSPHTMPSLTYYCSRLLQALSVRRVPGEKHAEMEKAALASFKKNPSRIRNNNDDDDSEDESRSRASKHNLQIPELKSNAPPFPEQPEFSVDLDSVINDDTTWIDKIFQP